MKRKLLLLFFLFSTLFGCKKDSEPKGPLEGTVWETDKAVAYMSIPSKDESEPEIFYYWWRIEFGKDTLCRFIKFPEEVTKKSPAFCEFGKYKADNIEADIQDWYVLINIEHGGRLFKASFDSTLTTMTLSSLTNGKEYVMKRVK